MGFIHVLRLCFTKGKMNMMYTELSVKESVSVSTFILLFISNLIANVIEKETEVSLLL